ncbi:hypothetical protein MFFC18_21260 [Mariniblastus fucicola]|uniref:Uncharacterized protein n=1 Tax=Mariniblastus fucicola TaxID=980251 RepID=A0A5B9PB86_9BACT|nr:hypothetical protein MFFC18_21260 [Mariniblastus fucicola]
MNASQSSLTKILAIIALYCCLLAFITQLPYSHAGLATAILSFAVFVIFELACVHSSSTFSVLDFARFLAYLSNSILSAFVVMIVVHPSFGPDPKNMSEFTRNLESIAWFFSMYAMAISAASIFGLLLTLSSDFRQIFTLQWALLNACGLFVAIYTLACLTIETLN